MRATRRDDGHVFAGVAQIELGPPAAVAERAPSLATRALVSVGLLAGLFVVALLLVVGLIGLNLLVLQTGRVVIPLAAVTVVVILSIGKSLLAMIRRPDEPLDEVEVPADGEPELHQRVRAIARTVGTRPPDRIVVTAEVNAYVREFGPLMGLVSGTRTLAIGMPLVDVLTVAQLEAVLAHELGHLAGGDTRLGPLAFRTDQAAMRMIASLRGRAVATIFVGYWRFQHRVSASVRRGQELVADRAAVQIAGRRNAADALHRVGLAGDAEALYRVCYLRPLLEAGCRPPDLAFGLRKLLRDPARLAELSEELAVEQEQDPWATHPPTMERIRRLAALPEPSGDVATDDRPASVLWSDAERWTQVAHETWLRVLTGGRTDLRVVPWTAFGQETVERDQRACAADVDAALAGLGLPPGVAGVRAALTTARAAALAGELLARGWRAPGEDEREAILLSAIRAAVVREALDRQVGQLRFSWSEPMQLVDRSDQPIPVGDLARAALAGSWTAIDAATGPAQAGAPRAPAAAQPHAAFAPAHPMRAPEPTPRPDPAPAEAIAPPAVPPAPSPPFVPCPPAPGGWLWAVEVPSTLVTRARLVIGPDAFAVGTSVARYDDVRAVAVKVVNSNGGVQATVKVRLASGATLKLSGGAVGGNKKAIVQDTVQYLWVLFRARVAPRLRAEIVAAIEQGAEVKVGSLRLSRSGITYKATRTRHAPWRDVVDAFLEDGVVHVFGPAGPPVTVPLDAENAFVLMDLIPELRVRFG